MEQCQKLQKGDPASERDHHKRRGHASDNQRVSKEQTAWSKKVPFVADFNFDSNPTNVDTYIYKLEYVYANQNEQIIEFVGPLNYEVRNLEPTAKFHQQTLKLPRTAAAANFVQCAAQRHARFRDENLGW